MRLNELRIKQKAAEVYATFDENEIACVRFGMLPYAKVTKAEKELAEEFAQADGEPPNLRDLTRLMAVALMDCTKQHGGMIA